MTSVRLYSIAIFSLFPIFLLLLSSSPSHAQLETLVGDLDNGAGVAEACVACHGEDGMGYPEGTPRLAGQSSKYLVRQLFQMRQSTRLRMGVAVTFDNEQATMTGTSKMRSMARSFDGMDDAIGFLDDQDIVDVAAYFDNLSCIPMEKPLVEAPAAIARCKFCHGMTGNKASATVPSIASQRAVYIRRQLKFFRATPKLNEALLKEGMFRFSRIMHTNSKRLTADDINDVSDYYSAQSCK
jgi:cytochrome c553